MSRDDAYLSPSAAARSLGVSPKALRLYEARGLIAPGRDGAGWRVYGPEDRTRAARVVALRDLGFSLAGIARVLDGDLEGLDQALAAHQEALEDQMRDLGGSSATVGAMRAALARGEAPEIARIADLASGPQGVPAVAFDLPWPWGGERFELPEVKPITHIVGPLGSGKTQLAKRLAMEIPGARFLGLERDGATTEEPRAARVAATLAWLSDDGATSSDALTALVAALEQDTVTVDVVDLIEHGLDEPTQAALIAYLRRRAPTARPIFAMTRSNVILDLDAVGPHEQILLCPANHAPPSLVAPFSGTPGYEAVVTCLADPEVRARSQAPP
jgi:DNA-binding transcriptional MerR regulator